MWCHSLGHSYTRVHFINMCISSTILDGEGDADNITYYPPIICNFFPLAVTHAICTVLCAWYIPYNDPIILTFVSKVCGERGIEEYHSQSWSKTDAVCSWIPTLALTLNKPYFHPNSQRAFQFQFQSSFYVNHESISYSKHLTVPMNSFFCPIIIFWN